MICHQWERNDRYGCAVLAFCVLHDTAVGNGLTDKWLITIHRLIVADQSRRIHHLMQVIVPFTMQIHCPEYVECSALRCEYSTSIYSNIAFICCFRLRKRQSSHHCCVGSLEVGRRQNTDMLSLGHLNFIMFGESGLPLKSIQKYWSHLRLIGEQ